MAKERIFILCALACLFRTSAAATIPIACQHEGVTYQSGERILVDYCNALICNDKGEIVPDAPHCVFDGTLFKSVLRLGNSLTLPEIYVAERLFLVCLLMCISREQLPPPSTATSTSTPLAVTTTTSSETTSLTTPPTTLPIVCTYGEFSYGRGTTFPAGNCSTGYCDESGDLSFTSICCEYEGNYFAVNSFIVFNDCKSGKCESDLNFVVDEVDCIPPDCQHTVHVEGECCEACSEDFMTPCQYEGQYYEFGHIIHLDSCNAILCDESGEFFPDITCCTYEGQNYKLDTSFAVDKCSGGYCNIDGSVQPYIKSCPYNLNCLPQNDPENECCPLCTTQMTPISPASETTPESTTTPMAVP